MLSELLARTHYRKAAELLRVYGHTPNEITHLYKSRFLLFQKNWIGSYNESDEVIRSVVERFKERAKWKEGLREAYQRIIPV
jgi:acyl carrier protein phosphodiesterase